ncbi:MAG: indole-3-glycerol-phosphate synthase [Myxococcales bacterium]|nr:indole-3-glycerol-phosphate synthase [Myxococcales bacterium]
MNYLETIVARKRREVKRRKRHKLAAVFQPEACHTRFTDPPAALRRQGAAAPRIIAEIKFESPSKGVLRDRQAGEAARIARGFERSGAAAVSVLCDAVSFGGTPLDVRRVSQTVRLPVLFKEFVIDEVQLDLARAMGATFVLLIVAALEDRALDQLVKATRKRGMEPLVEVYSERELDRALGADAHVIGVNARDLRTFRVAPRQAQQVIRKVPGSVVSVWMSGLRCRKDLEELGDERIDAALLGEALMRANDPEAALLRLTGG